MLLLLLFAPLWTGCAAPAPEPVLVKLSVPPSLLACQSQPVPPDPMKNDADLAYFIVDLAAAGDDCRQKLDAVRGLVQ